LDGLEPAVKVTLLIVALYNIWRVTVKRGLEPLAILISQVVLPEVQPETIPYPDVVGTVQAPNVPVTDEAVSVMSPLDISVLLQAPLVVLPFHVQLMLLPSLPVTVPLPFPEKAMVTSPWSVNAVCAEYPESVPIAVRVKVRFKSED
jgi:hypothetical protein